MGHFDETFDFVVVGSGGGSMCGGLVMRRAGKSVVILEKTDLVGGTTAKSGGVMWIPNNRFMARDGVADSPEAAVTYLNATVGSHNDIPGATPARRRAYVDNAPKMVDFLVDSGIKLTRVSYYPDYYDDRPGGVERGRTVVAQLFNKRELGAWADKLRPGFMPVPAMLEEAFDLPTFKKSWKGRMTMFKVGLRIMLARLTGAKWTTCGEALQGRMLQAALKAGIDIRRGSPVSTLIVENGAVTGVVTTKNGQPWRIGARLGVLVNAGGFARNQRMRDRYIPGTSADWTAATPGDTGEMIEEMERIGAALGQMSETVGNPRALPPGMPLDGMTQGTQKLTASPHGMIVDQSGVRYMNEGGSYMEFCRNQLERHQTVPAVPSWGVFDQQSVDKYMLFGTLPGSSKPQAWYDSGFLKRADTVEALAGQMGVDAKALRGTVDRFNDFSRKGRDEDFHRGDRAFDRWLGDKFHDPAALGTIEKGPFYAVEVYPGDVGTYGGVITDVNARVLREDGSPISGLYATGVSTASVMGKTYPGAGASVGPSFVWGFVAANHAVAAERVAP